MVNYRRLVQSRKRKLNQLFSISVPIEDPTYKQKLQAFHDANDLERYAFPVAVIKVTLCQVA